VNVFCLVADRDMINAEALTGSEGRDIPYIPGSRTRKNKEVQNDVFLRGGRYKEVYPETRYRPSSPTIRRIM